MLNRFRIGSRLAIGFGSLIFALGAAFVASVLIGLNGQQGIQRVDQNAAQRDAVVRNMREAQLQLVSSIRSAGLQTDGGKLNQDVEEYRSALKSLLKSEGEFASFDMSADSRASFDKAKELRQQVEPVADEAIKFTMAFAGDQAAKLLSEKLIPLERQWTKQLVELMRIESERADAAREEIAQANRSRVVMLAVLLLTVVLLGGAFAFTMTRSVTHPLRDAVQAARRVAGGDLSARVESSGNDEAAELLQALEGMRQSLADMVAQVRETTSGINVASNEIATGSNDLSLRTEQTSGQLQQTASSMGNLTEAVQQSAEHVRQARSLAESATDVARRGGNAVQQVVETMGSIQGSSNRIVDIITVIDGIAFQTNILALNAAVEAARAGEQGRGFAVVAGEVRSLAQRSAEAAKEIKVLIQDSVQRVESGAHLVSEAGNTMADIVRSVQKLNDIVGEISTALGEQSHGIAEINKAIVNLEQTTQQNAALVEQSSAATHSLNDQAQQLAEAVSVFNIEGNRQSRQLAIARNEKSSLALTA